MPTLAQTLSTTAPLSALARKARRLGLRGLPEIIGLAVQRGCAHYSGFAWCQVEDPGRDNLSDAELTTLLLVGEHPYEPVAIRCAAQLARSPGIQPETLARLAKMEKTERVLAHIARAGALHDSSAPDFWSRILACLPPLPARKERDLPHWTRFVSLPGRQKDGIQPPVWLQPDP